MEKQDAILKGLPGKHDTERLLWRTGLGLNIAKGIVDMYGGTLKWKACRERHYLSLHPYIQ